MVVIRRPLSVSLRSSRLFSFASVSGIVPPPQVLWVESILKIQNRHVLIHVLAGIANRQVWVVWRRIDHGWYFGSKG